MLNPDASLEAEKGLGFHVNIFKTYLKYTYYLVGQVLGLNTPDFMMIESMVIIADIQCLNARDFDFATFIARQINLSLLAMKNDTSKIYFPHYSLLMHMILFYGQDLGICPKEMTIRQLDNDNQPLPVQLWTSIWDCRFVRSNYIHFEEYFVKSLYKSYDQPCGSTLTHEVKRFLRLADIGRPKIIKHNWGDWYCFSNVTMIRVYGFEDSAFLLPKIVPNRIAYLEIIRQMGISNHIILNKHDKQPFMPGTICIDESTITRKEGHELTLNKLAHYNMKLGAPRKGFDPEGYINAARRKQKLGEYEHIPFVGDDLISNLDEKEAEMAIDNHNKEIEQKMRET